MYAGATGTGKSQLSIDLAKALKGQVINGDALQVYRTANILTNKVTKEEMGGVKHHLIDFLPPTEKYDVYRFKTDAIHVVNPISHFSWGTDMGRSIKSTRKETGQFLSGEPISTFNPSSSIVPSSPTTSPTDPLC